MLIFLVGCYTAVAFGCGKPDEVSTYTVPKLQERMLASMTIESGRAWFFKLMGPAHLVGNEAADFRKLVESVQFSDGQPSWDLPDGWSNEASQDQTRHATIRTGDTPGSLSGSVVLLQAPPGNVGQYELANINRWRGQLGLASITSDEIDGAVERIALKNGKAIWLDCTGTPSGGGMRAPFMAGNRPHPPIEQDNTKATGGGQHANSSPLLSFKEPESWQPGRMSSMRKAAFLAKLGEESAEITVIDLAAGAGNLLDNVNRWRGQVGLEPIDDATLKEQLLEVQVDDVAGQYVEMFGPEVGESAKAILGVIAVRKERAWFVKLTGPAKLAAIEKGRFLEFVKSITFTQ